jgi:urease accessory protein
MNAKLHIKASLRSGVTCLKNCYATPPFKLANITEDKHSEQLELMMMCSSPGILDNDNYEIKVVLDKDCNVQLHTQSYQRLFSMQDGAKQLMEVQLAAGASFVYLPHPAVPHAQSISTSKNKIYLGRNSSLIWGEILTCGRQMKDEVFTLSKFHTITEVFIENKMAIKENLLMEPALFDIQGMGLLEGFTHQASMICSGSKYGTVDKMNEVFDFLSSLANIEFGISKTPCAGFVVRILGYKAEQLHNCLKSVAKIIQMNAFSTIHS